MSAVGGESSDWLILPLGGGAWSQGDRPQNLVGIWGRGLRLAPGFDSEPVPRGHMTGMGAIRERRDGLDMAAVLIRFGDIAPFLIPVSRWIVLFYNCTGQTRSPLCSVHAGERRGV